MADQLQKLSIKEEKSIDLLGELFSKLNSMAPAEAEELKTVYWVPRLLDSKAYIPDINEKLVDIIQVKSELRRLISLKKEGQLFENSILRSCIDTLKPEDSKIISLMDKEGNLIEALAKHGVEIYAGSVLVTVTDSEFALLFEGVDKQLYRSLDNLTQEQAIATIRDCAAEKETKWKSLMEFLMADTIDRLMSNLEEFLEEGYFTLKKRDKLTQTMVDFFNDFSGAINSQNICVWDVHTTELIRQMPKSARWSLIKTMIRMVFKTNVMFITEAAKDFKELREKICEFETYLM